MSDLVSQPAEIHFTMQITRAATGETENVDMVGHVVAQPTQEQSNERNAHHSS